MLTIALTTIWILGTLTLAIGAFQGVTAEDY